MLRAVLCAAILFTASAAHADAAADIKKTNADFAAAWNKHDPKAMSSWFADDGDLINPAGQVARGKAEVEKLFTMEQTGPMKGSTFSSTCGAPRMLKPDVALVDCSFEVQNVQMPDGKMGPLKGGYTVVMTSQGGAWKVSAGRAMVPPPPPPQATPAHK